MLSPRAFVLIIALAISPTAHAANAYKCVDATGAISFQDQPCRTGQTQQSIRLPDTPAPAGPGAQETPPPAPPPQPLAQTPAPPTHPLPPQIPPPAFYLCVRGDGTTYMSDSGQGGSMSVPLGVMGIPDRSLADAYSGPNAIGVSAPGLRKIPNLPAGSVPFGGMYTQIYDQCHFAQPAEACSFLRAHLDDVSLKLRRAFSDEAPQLEQQQITLRDRMRGC